MHPAKNTLDCNARRHHIVLVALQWDVVVTHLTWQPVIAFLHGFAFPELSATGGCFETVDARAHNKQQTAYSVGNLCRQPLQVPSSVFTARMSSCQPNCCDSGFKNAVKNFG